MFMDSYERDGMSGAKFLRSHPEALDAVPGTRTEGFSILAWIHSLLTKLFQRKWKQRGD